MRKAVFKVPRKLKWYIESHLSGEDQQTFWLLQWHALQQANARTAYKATFLAGIFIVPLAALILQSPAVLGISAVVTPVLLFSIGRHGKRHRDAEFNLKQADLEKWSDIRSLAQEISWEQRRSNDSAEVVVEIPG